MANAAAPKRPAAWVAMGAPPVNWEAEDEGAEGKRALVAPATPEETLEDEIALATLDASAALDETTDWAAEETLATAEEAAPAPGISMGAPASWQVFCTAEMVEAWSEAEHAPSTQGCTLESSWAPF
jgi:hypothetical protein